MSDSSKFSSSLDRRRFLEAAVAATAALGGSSLVAQEAAAKKDADEAAAKKNSSANDTIVLAIMGTNGRGTDLAQGFARERGCEVAFVCDVDQRAIGKGQQAVESSASKRRPEGVGDFRKVLDDKSVDALVIAAPDHWHAPATILACAAGKHVYCEKPCCHNPHEGELMVQAARKHNRVVQIGTQRRSTPAVIEAIAQLRNGAIGRVLMGRAWYNNKRPSIGHGSTAPVPSWLDYALWQGPAPERPFRDNVVHYNWHWFWHWGTGELGNNGIHGIDVVRWGMDVNYPTRVTAGGGKYRWDDDQETPDTHNVTFDFDGKSLVWEGRSWSPRGFEGSGFGMAFYGDEGTLVVGEDSYKIFDMKNTEAKTGGRSGGEFHLANFLDCVRSGKRPNADIEEGHKSTLLCHLGNIAYRTGRVLSIDPTNGHIKNDSEAEGLWRREYRGGWEPQA
jgi:predicted dehydrogenase